MVAQLTQEVLVRIILSPGITGDDSRDSRPLDQMHIFRVDQDEFGPAMLNDV